MAQLDHIFTRFREIDDPLVDQALGAALATAEPDAVAKISRLLLERNHADGKTYLVKYFHKLPAEIQQVCLDRIADFYDPICKAAQLWRTHGPKNVTEIVRRSRSARLAYLVADQLEHGSCKRRQDAAHCLLELAHGCRTDRPGPRSCTTGSTVYLQAAIERAIETYDRHRHRELLCALAALVPRPMLNAINQLFREPGQAAADLQKLLQQADDPNICRALTAWVHHPVIGRAAIEGLERAVQGPNLPQILATTHLLRHDASTRALRDLRKPGRLVPPAERAALLPAHPSRSLAGWIAALPLKPQEEIDRLATLVQLPDRLARLTTLSRLIHLAENSMGEYANRTICSYCQDPDPTLARIALRHLLGFDGPDLPRLLVNLTRSAHDQVREIAKARLVPVAFTRLWNNWPKLTRSQRLAAGRGMLKLDPEFHHRLGQKLAETDDRTRLRALAIVQQLNQGDLFEPALLMFAQSDDPRISSAAVRALGSVQSDQASHLLREALRHPDSRVRANAIEALQQADVVEQVDDLCKMAREDENRPRANAIGALLTMRNVDAITTLRAMLGDSRSAHRTSALWLVETLGITEVATRVAELSITEKDRRVKERAEGVVWRLVDIMRRPPQERNTQTALAA